MFVVYWWYEDYDKEIFCVTREAADQVFEKYCHFAGTVRLYEGKNVKGVVTFDWDAPIRERKEED